MEEGNYAPEIISSVEKELDTADVLYSDEYTEVFLSGDEVTVKLAPRVKKDEKAPRIAVKKIKNKTVFTMKKIHKNGQVSLTCSKSDLID